MSGDGRTGDGRVHRTERMEGPAEDVDVHMFPGGLRACLEAVLMAADRPLEPADLARVLGVSEADALDALRALREDYDGGGAAPRGFELRESARGWRLCSRRSFAPVVSRFVTDGQTARLSQAALEALAIIAYRQPVTRAQVSAIRGVASDGVIRSLTVRGLVHEAGVDGESRAALLGTTPLFLELMGMRSLDDLPALAPFLPSAADAAEAAASRGVASREAVGAVGSSMDAAAGAAVGAAA